MEDSSVDDESDDVVEEDKKYSSIVWLMVDVATFSAGSCTRVRSATFAELVIVGLSTAASADFSSSDVSSFFSSGFLTSDYCSFCSFRLSSSRSGSSKDSFRSKREELLPPDPANVF